MKENKEQLQLRSAEEIKPLIDEVFADNGEHSHWRLIDPKTGSNLWSEDSEEDAARGYPVKESQFKSSGVFTLEDMKKAFESGFSHGQVLHPVRFDEWIKTRKQ